MKDENAEIRKDKGQELKKGVALEKQLIQETAQRESEEFRNKLLEEKITKFKTQVLKLQQTKGDLEFKREKIEGEMDQAKEDWELQKRLTRELSKKEKMQKEMFEQRSQLKEDFIEKLLDMLKIPLIGLKNQDMSR